MAPEVALAAGGPFLLDGWKATRRIDYLRIPDTNLNVHLSSGGRLLTVTDDFNNGANVSIVLRYRQP